MNEIVNKVLLAGGKFMSEMHLRQLGFIYSACEPFTKKKESIKKIKKTGDSTYICRNQLDKASCQHDMTHGDFINLKRRTFADKLLSDQAINNAKDPEYHGYQRGLASMFSNFLDKKSSGSGIKNKNISNKELTKELHKPIIIRFNKREVQSPFVDNIWGGG